MNVKPKSVYIVPFLLSSLLLTGFKKSKPPLKDTRPNIVLILADDMGFSDAGCYGGEIHTPNLDFLSANGIRYTQFYNTSRCCPTRASLLTGLYNQQAGIGKMTDAEDEPGYLGHISDNAVTLAEVLKTAGYQTAMSGKWHVSNTNGQKTAVEQMAWLNHHQTFGDFSPIAQYPTSRGFDKFFGTIWGVVDFFDPFSLVSGTIPITNVPDHYYHTDAINDTAVAYIKGYAETKKPFFLYVAHNAPHWPLMALPEDIAKYKDTYKAGWKAIRNARYNKLVKMGLIDPATTPLPQRWKQNQTWAQNPDTAWDAMAMAVHAAMIDRMDQGIGRMIDALKVTGQLDNTLILFLSDNDASPENCANYGPGFDRPDETRDGRKIIYATKKQAMPGPQTTYASIGQTWANVANIPYQYWKAESYEGGIHTPLIAYWPKGITTNKGGFSDHAGHVMDFMATFTELAHAQYPQIYHGHKIPATTGISLLPSFKSKKTTGHDQLFNEHFGARYARSGNWKVVSLSNDTTWQLFNLAADKTETNNLAAQYPEKVQQLQTLWYQWAQTHQVFPKPGSRKKEK
ncbi:arylsulfatase [Chitinophaga ginsengisegetis]|uniref:arylsulfatase n=1 Tax=Chitinophaga ginsengisegetis TaxID=393003 RepID=UPI000DB99358|nr:arylsulfatase [Chitinophaga ginsengisegetis]MDR6568046.1 arylsulfatase [Chitinophaga ginsengisegetis]MDR6647399.1 arylsulfatase [Chitinophaga ginsengisegetis]MDR6653749.1 arylsulfatase [Chitinophaga ginsengisegetis]